MASKLEELRDAHPKWKQNIDRWTFLWSSYAGGEHYRNGDYLAAYMLETKEEYEERLDNTALDNHVRSVVAIINSFLFRQPPKRELGSIANDPGMVSFMKDSDLDGRSFDAVMRDISTYSSIYGHCLVVMDKPSSNAFTRAEELEQGVRPYISIYTPENVLDWKYTRASNGAYYMSYVKLYEGIVDGVSTFRTYTPTEIIIESVDEDEVIDTMIMPNELGKVPAVTVYSIKGPERGIGISDVADVADMQRSIYNELSELEQNIRLSGHPSLVKHGSTQAAAGAGSIVQIPEDPGPDYVRPYLLQPSGTSIESILASINSKIGAIDRMSHMGGIRSIESRRLSGVALATEFQLLNARLAEKADNLEHAEEQIWTLYAMWQDLMFDGDIKYPDSFNIQDKYNDMNMLKLAKDAGIEDPILRAEVEDQMLKILVSEEKYEELKSQPQKDLLVHTPVTNPTDLVQHLRDMVAVGYNNDEILSLHPELASLFAGGANEGQ
jgi:hypothetical protein